MAGYDDFHNEYGDSYDCEERDCATCNYCSHSWWQTKEEIEREIEHIRAYDEWTREQERPWNRFKVWLRYTWPVQWYWNWRWRSVVKHDFTDEVPF